MVLGGQFGLCAAVPAVVWVVPCRKCPRGPKNAKLVLAGVEKVGRRVRQWFRGESRYDHSDIPRAARPGEVGAIPTYPAAFSVATMWFGVMHPEVVSGPQAQQPTSA